MDLVEGLAATEGVRLCSESGCRPFHLETDSSRIFQLLQGDVEDLSEVGMVTSSLRQHLSSVGFPSFFTLREVNQAADCLAKLALQNRWNQVWVEDYPKELSSFLVVNASFVIS